MKKKEDWKIEKLGDVCIIERGGSPRPIEKYITSDKNGINWIKIGDAKEGTMIISSTKERIKPEGMSKSRFVRKGDFILSNSMSFGKPYILGVDGCIHDGWLVIRDEKGVFDKSFLYYFLGCKYTYQTFKEMAVGGVVNNLNSKMVRGLMIPIPPLPIQHQIVSELDTLSDIISKKKQQLEELDKLAQATFYDMFGDPVSNEKGWEVKLLGEISSLKSGQFVKANDIQSHYSNGLYPCFGGNGLRGFTKIFTHNGEFVLIGRQGALCGNVKIAKEKFHATEHAVVCTPLVNYETLWFYFMLKTLNINKYATGAAQPGLAVGKLEKIEIPFSPLLFQNKFARQIESIEKQKALINQSIGDVQQLFDYTMDKYFN